MSSGLDRPLVERRRLLTAAAAVAAAVAWTWSLVIAPPPQLPAPAVRLLLVVAGTALALTALLGAARLSGRDRAALLTLTAGAEVWACLQLALALGVRSAALEDALPLPLALGGVGALWALRAPQPAERVLRVAAEWALVAVAVLLWLRLAVPLPDGSFRGLAAQIGTAGAAVLAAGALLTWADPASTRRAWPLLPGALVGLAAALALDGLATGRVAAWTGPLLALVLAATALAVARDGHGTAMAPPALRSSPAVGGVLLVSGASALAAVGASWATGDPPGPLEVGLAGVLLLLAFGHAHLLAQDLRGVALELAEAEERHRYLAYHDHLTGLPNRTLLLDRLTLALDLHRRHRLPVSVLYADLDGFKAVNDRHGHAVGDAVLRALATRLRRFLRPEDVLARVGGDEFVLLLEHATRWESAAERLEAAMDEPVEIGELSFSLRLSIGCARVEPDDPTPAAEDVLERADADMYASKRRQRRHAAATGARSGADDDALRAARSAAALAAALEGGQVFVVYQPQVDVATGRVRGLEALARWRHDGRVVLPKDFLPVAEQFGLTEALTDTVLEQACAQLSAWTAADPRAPVTVSVNVPASMLPDPALGERVRAAAARHGLDPCQVVLEATVDAVATWRSSGPPPAADGPRLSLTGFTGAPEHFDLLSAAPVTAVKVDGNRAAGDRLLNVLLALAPQLHLAVVVERVECPADLAALRELDGVLAQGYLLSRPAQGSAVTELVRHGCPVPT